MSWFDGVLSVLEILMLARATWWVYFQGGGDLLLEHRKMFRFPNSKILIVLLWTVMVAVLGYSFAAEIVPRVFSR